MPVRRTASAERIAHVVYVDSDIPRDGDTSVPPSQHAAMVELARLNGDGWRVPPAVTRAGDLLLSELPDERRRWIAARFAPQLLGTWLQPIRLTGAADALPTTYIRCTVGYDPTDEDTQRQDARIRASRIGATASWRPATPRPSRRRRRWPNCCWRSPRPRPALPGRRSLRDARLAAHSSGNASGNVP